MVYLPLTLPPSKTRTCQTNRFGFDFKVPNLPFDIPEAAFHLSSKLTDGLIHIPYKYSSILYSRQQHGNLASQHSLHYFKFLLVANSSYCSAGLFDYYIHFCLHNSTVVNLLSINESKVSLAIMITQISYFLYTEN